MKLNAKMMTYNKISKTDIEIEIEKGIVKQRYDSMKNSDDEDEEEESVEKETMDLENKTVDYTKCRATDIPTNPRLIMPQPASLSQETAMSSMKEKMLQKVKEYVRTKCDERGFPQSNLSKEERSGMKEIKNKIDQKELVCFKTDKSGKLTVDTAENYTKAIKVHTENDTKINMSQVEQIETEMNRQLKQFNKMFQVGAAHPRDKDRINIASTSTNVPPPPLYGLRKDHKVIPPGQESAGPPVRPVCAAKSAPNSRMSYFLCKMLNELCESVEEHNECKSSEEMRSHFDKFNNEQAENAGDKKRKLLSMDVKSMYPRIKRKVAAQAVKDLVMETDVEFENVDYHEVAKYLAVMLTPAEIEDEKLTDVIPKRVKKARRKLTTNCLFSNKPEAEEWLPAARPDSSQKRIMLANTLSVGVEAVMMNHTYTLADEIYIQSEGCPIGLDLSQAVARVVMMKFDKLYLKKVGEEGIIMHLYSRYIDDSNQVVEDNEDDEEKSAQKLINIANGLLDGIEMEEDLPSRYEDKKLPILDMKCWISEDGHLEYEHYEKPMASKLVIPARSAHSDNSKRNVHVCELVRRLMNTSRRLSWSQYFVPILEEYMKRMMKAGYHEEYRKDVLAHALNIYQTKLDENDAGGVPLNRPNSYKKVERKKQKKIKKRNWSKKGDYVAPIIIPATPNSELAKMLREVAETEKDKRLRFKIVEKGGKTIERSLMRPNPTGDSQCKKPKCPVCPSGGTMCHKHNICYKYKCNICEEDVVYIGETSRNLYSRGMEHSSLYEKESPKSFLHNHQVEQHNSEPADFDVKVIKSFKDPLSRQVTEAVMIKNHTGELLNSKSEFHQPPIVRVRSEVIRGVGD